MQTSLCPRWMLPVYNRLVAIQKPGAEQHPYIAGLVSQHAADKVFLIQNLDSKFVVYICGRI